ncbi:contractile injection system protein, VgrG/Pvc8 family [Burkholderia sp. A2]|uniref:contractile injection system protein, VgrG/Pvc8 family n=1 Tax=Burkholderia sp. A2 TaxID=236253 RepID=UPI000B0F65D0
MNAVTKTLVDALRHPSARLSQRLGIWIGTLDLGLDVLDFKVRAGFCRDYKVDVTVTSPHLDIDGKQCVGRRAGLQIDERVAVPSVNYVDPVEHAAATFNGIVTRWKRIRTSRDEAAYQLRIEPRFAALLKRVHGSRVFRDKSLQEIITELVVDRRNFDAFDIEFNLEGVKEKLEQVVMYEESVWNFIARHCRRKGIFWFYKQGRGKQGQLDTVVFADNPRAYVRSIEVPLMPDSGLTGNWHEAVLSLNGERTLVPAEIEVWERNYRTPEDPLCATATVSDESGDRSVFGRINRSAEFHLTQQGARRWCKRDATSRSPVRSLCSVPAT